MQTRFQQQEAAQASPFLKSAATPQHGKKADEQASKVREPRSFQPRPGH